MFRKGFIFLTILALAVMVAGNAEGDTKEVLTLEEEVVTGSRIYTDLDELPAPAYVIDREEIEKSSASTLSQILSKVPGISNRSREGSAQEEYIEIRGLTTEILFLVDGVPYYKTSHVAGAAAVDLRSLPLENIERIEVIKGAGSAVYGSMAAAGVINIITRKPGDQEVRLSLGGGTHDRKEGSFWVSVPGKKLNSSIWFSHRQEDESPLLQYLNSSEIFEDKNLDYENDSGGFSLNSGPVDFSATWGEYSSEWTYLGFNQKQENDYNRFSLSWKGRESRFIIYRDKQEKDLAQDSEYGMSKTEVKDTSWGAEYSRQEFFEKFLMSWGIAYRNEDMQYLYSSKNFNRKRNNYAPFVEFSVPVGEMIVDTGLRYELWDQDGAEDYDELIPKVSLSWQNSAGNLWYLSAGRFFAMPSLYELSESSGLAEPNLSLNPEKGWSYELGYKKNLDRGSWNLGVFYLDMEDKIKWAGSNLPPYNGSYTNVSEFRSWGVESLRTWNLSRQWDLSLGLTWMNAEEKDDTSSDWLKGGSPTWDIDATMAYDRGPLSGELSVNYLGDREDQREGMGQRSQGDVTTVDARLSYTTGGGTLRLEGYNIFDKEYWLQDYTNWGTTTRYYGPEARFYVTWNYQF